MKIISAWKWSTFEWQKQNYVILIAEYKFFGFIYPRNYLETATSPGPVTFCHNDLQQGMMTSIK